VDDVLLIGRGETWVLFLGFELVIRVLVPESQSRVMFELPSASPFDSYSIGVASDDDGGAIGSFGWVDLGRVDALWKIEAIGRSQWCNYMKYLGFDCTLLGLLPVCRRYRGRLQGPLCGVDDLGKVNERRVTVIGIGRNAATRIENSA